MHDCIATLAHRSQDRVAGEDNKPFDSHVATSQSTALHDRIAMITRRSRRSGAIQLALCESYRFDCRLRLTMTKQTVLHVSLQLKAKGWMAERSSRLDTRRRRLGNDQRSLAYRTQGSSSWEGLTNLPTVTLLLYSRRRCTIA